MHDYNTTWSTDERAAHLYRMSQVNVQNVIQIPAHFSTSVTNTFTRVDTNIRQSPSSNYKHLLRYCAQEPLNNIWQCQHEGLDGVGIECNPSYGYRNAGNLGLLPPGGAFASETGLNRLQTLLQNTDQRVYQFGQRAKTLEHLVIEFIEVLRIDPSTPSMRLLAIN